jgi:predicted  nucleic acid-binding Zn-ribbon protein
MRLEIEGLEKDRIDMGETMVAISYARERVQVERDEAREQYGAALREVQNLEPQIKPIEINLSDEQRKYDFVNQDYLGLLHTIPAPTPDIV